jgi:hypothetical protein
VTAPLRLMVYDRTCTGRPFLPGLTHAWASGAWLYRALGRFDAHFGAASWAEALAWLGDVDAGRPVAEIQYWGHGKWGKALIDRVGLGVDALASEHEHHTSLARIRERMLPAGQSLWWFRTCELFGADAGHEFARAWSDFFDATTAGHTFIISHWQSGLHSLRPGQTPSWSAEEGLIEGTAAEPVRARWSSWRAPNTVSFLSGHIPPDY